MQRNWCGLQCSLPGTTLLGMRLIRHWLKLAEPRPACGKLRSVESQVRTSRHARACAVELLPGWFGDLSQANKARTGSIVCGSPEWALSRLVEAKHGAQCAVRRGATASSFTNVTFAFPSFKQGHQVTEECRHEDLIILREGGPAP